MRGPRYELACGQQPHAEQCHFGKVGLFSQRRQERSKSPRGNEIVPTCLRLSVMRMRFPLFQPCGAPRAARLALLLLGAGSLTGPCAACRRQRAACCMLRRDICVMLVSYRCRRALHRLAPVGHLQMYGAPATTADSTRWERSPVCDAGSGQGTWQCLIFCECVCVNGFGGDDCSICVSPPCSKPTAGLVAPTFSSAPVTVPATPTPSRRPTPTPSDKPAKLAPTLPQTVGTRAPSVPATAAPSQRPNDPYACTSGQEYLDSTCACPGCTASPWRAQAIQQNAWRTGASKLACAR